MKTLGRWQNEWTEIYLTNKQGAHWTSKFAKNRVRMAAALQICGTEDTLKRKRRTPDTRTNTLDEEFFDLGGGVRLNEDPLKALRRITYGNGKWAKTYVSQCKVQPMTQINRAKKWFPILKEKFTKNLQEMQIL